LQEEAEENECGSTFVEEGEELNRSEGGGGEDRQRGAQD